MTTPFYRRLGMSLVLFASVVAGLPAAEAQDMGLSRGDAVVTGFSGIKPLDVPVPPGTDPLDYFFIDLQGASAEILSLSALGSGPHGQLALAPVKRQITAGQVGQVFAVTLDNGLGQDVPNIYLGATSAYGIQIVGPDTDGDGNPNRLKLGQPGAQFMAGQFGPAPDGNPGTIWRVDGTTGAVSVFATLPNNSGPAIGDVVFDSRTQQFFASDLDTGLIYRISADGTVIDSFDHGISGRPAKGLAPVADDGKVMDITNPSFDSQNPATWGYTQKERMVWGMAVHDGRLYYAVDGQVWSAGIAEDGSFAGDPRWELDATALPGQGPIADMLFDNQGRMLLSQRGELRGSYDYSVFAEPGKSSVVRYVRETPDDPTTPSVWATDADEYAIGMRPEYRYADGGIALGYAHDPETGALVPGSCSTTLWSTGSRLRSSENPDVADDGSGEADVHGLQGNDASLVRPQNVPPSQSYFIDYDGLFGDAAKSGHIGDVAIWQPCDHEGFGLPGEFGELPPGFYPPGIIVPPGFPPEFPPPHKHHHTNLRLKKHAIGQCFPWAGGWACPYVISIRNTGPDDYFGQLLISDYLPAMPPGALMGFAGPPWSCSVTSPSHYNCWRPATYIAVGASRYLYAVAWVPNAYVQAGHCNLHNRAHIIWAPGGSQWNVNPADDADSATATIPSPDCKPKPTNLTVRKVGTGCIMAGNSLSCGYKVTVMNTGPGIYNDTIKVSDQPQTGTTATFIGAPWNCVASGTGYSCTHPTVSLPPNGTVSFNTTLNVPVAVAIAAGCQIKNRATIVYAPGGSPENTNAADDSSQATDVYPALCNPQEPAIHCPPGYEPENGACQPKVRPIPPPRHCPEGTVGDWPNCRQIRHHTCPEGTVKHGDACVKIEHRCPEGTVGQWPHCRQIGHHTCPEGTVKRGDACVKIVHHCPEGTIGHWPHCRKITVHHCPSGTVGRWPNCRKPPAHKCPSGTAGRWPNCRKLQQLNRRPQLQRPNASLSHQRFAMPMHVR
jgi:hypothetical protein